MPHFLVPLRQRLIYGLVAVLASGNLLSAQPQPDKPAPHLKEVMRMPWTRSQERFIRHWLMLSDIPRATATGAMNKDWLTEQGGETAIHPAEKMLHHLPDGSTVSWRAATAWGDAADLSDGNGIKRDLVGYAAATITRPAAGKALLCLGSDESVRAWVNGKPVLDRRGARPLTFDEDRIEVELNAGENLLLLKVEQQTGPWAFSARVLESGAIPARVQEIGPSFTEEAPASLVIKTDINHDHASDDKVTVQVIAAGGKTLAEKSAARGDSIRLDTARWPEGAYEIRCVTRKPDGLLYATHLPWFKGDAIAAARGLITAAAKADLKTPAGITTKMLGDMVLDRLGKEGLAVTGNPWWVIHSPLMEFAELQREAAGEKSARERPYGFVRLAWHDDTDGSPQFARAYLPGGYDRAKKWPLVIKLHGYNPPNPEYVRWWAADARHSLADAQYGNREGIIYLEPHGRGNTQYLGFGDQDVVRAIQLAKATLSVDEDRVYLCGDSMGGWGTWNVGTRHPDLFAALAPIFGGVDYHSALTEEQLAALNPLTRFLQEKQSSWAQADGLLNLPVLVHHGDADQSVNVDWSRYGVRLLQRWGYNVRYVEMPGYGHEDLNHFPDIINWFLEHRREPQPRHVRLRSAELQNAAAYWVAVDQADRPDRFMLVDATCTGANSLSVDSENVLALTLSPGASLVDAAQPVQVVWNGVRQSAALRDGRISLHAPGHDATPHAKNAHVAGPIGDVFNTPFAIVTGTASADPAMNEACRQKAEMLAGFWLEWQRQPARVFKDTELSDAEAARYSLILIGGADANLVARKFADKLPLRVTGDHVQLGSSAFAATDARVQMIFPHPLNPQRYVLIIAAGSTTGMQFWAPGALRGTEFDFTIEDGHVAGIGQTADRTDLWVAGGWFDRTWQVDEALAHEGKPTERAKSLVLLGAIDPKLLDAYAGHYEIAPGAVVSIAPAEGRLTARVGEQPVMGLLPAGDDRFYIAEGPVLVVFVKDDTGKVVSFKATQNGREFSGKKTD